MKNRTLAFLAVLCALGLSSCASPDTSKGRFKVGKPYRIGWKVYYPEENYSFTETGIASWYGPGFNGKSTASGERFDENALTAAHPTLQLPSLVRVTNLENGKSIVVRVTDRGPFHSNRVMDLSKRAAEELGFRSKGTAKIKLQVLEAESRALAAAAKQKLDTRGAEIAVNNTGMLEDRFAAFYPSEYKQKLEATAIEKVAYQPSSALEDVAVWNDAPVTAEPLSGLIQKNVPTVPPPERQALASYEPAIIRTRAGGARHPGIPAAILEPDDLRPRQDIAHQPVQAQIRPVSSSDIYVQAGSYASMANAQQTLRALSGFGSARIITASLGGKPYYRVRLGPIESVDKADILVNRLERAGRQATIVVSEN